MFFTLEMKKCRRSGMLPAFLGGGVLAASIPLVNMIFRWEKFVKMSSAPADILLSANWSSIAMLNLFLALAGACMLYYIENSGRAIEHLRTLPIREIGPGLGKFLLLALLCLLMMLIETAALIFCSVHWFHEADLSALLLSLGFSFWVMLPAIAAFLLIAELFKNMWCALGTGIICVFIASMLPPEALLTYFPFSMPYRFLTLLPAERSRQFVTLDTAWQFIAAAAVELLIFALLEQLLIKLRRRFS